MEKKKILIIDDEPDTLVYFSSLLEDSGYITVTAENGDEGLKKLQDDNFDLITLDVTMPEMSGVKCYRNIRENENFKNIPVIIITGISNDFKQFISTRKQVPPPEGYLSKPVEGNDLIELVKKLLN